jgi:hypothetical protein
VHASDGSRSLLPGFQQLAIGSVAFPSDAALANKFSESKYVRYGSEADMDTCLSKSRMTLGASVPRKEIEHMVLNCSRYSGDRVQRMCLAGPESVLLRLGSPC